MLIIAVEIEEIFLDFWENIITKNGIKANNSSAKNWDIY